MTGAATDSPELGSIVFRLTDSDREYPNAIGYSYAEDFLSPSDSWEVDLAEDSLSQDDIDALVPGARMQLSIYDLLQTTGFIDDVEIRTGRGGTVLHVEGRDFHESRGRRAGRSASEVSAHGHA